MNKHKNRAINIKLVEESDIGEAINHTCLINRRSSALIVNSCKIVDGVTFVHDSLGPDRAHGDAPHGVRPAVMLAATLAPHGQGQFLPHVAAPSP